MKDAQRDGTSAGGVVGLPAQTKVLTPTGWSALRDLRRGDRVVDADGGTCAVVQLTDVGVSPLLELVMADAAVISGGPDQLWLVEVGKGHRRTSMMLSTVRLQDLAARKVGVRLLRSKPVQMPGAAPLPLDPYLLGALLGDGSTAGGTAVKLWTCEPEIVAHTQRALPAGARFSDRPTRQSSTTGWGIIAVRRQPGGNPVLNALRELGLSGLLSFDKFLPSDFMWAPVEDRLALLQGLCDTDGTCDPNSGQVSFCTASAQLAEDVVHLVRSLGGRCSLHRRTNITYTSSTQRTPKQARDSFKVGGIRLFEFSPFRLTRKAERVRPAGKTPLWTVRTVRPGGIGRLMTLQVDGPSGLFLASDFVPVLSTNYAAAQASALAVAA